MSLNWRIYYGDGRTIDNTQSDPFAVDGVNVQAIVQADEDVGRYVVGFQEPLSGMSFYWWVEEDEQWHQGDHNGLWDYLSQPGAKKVLFGRSLSNTAYKLILERALKDEDFLPRTGREVTD